MKSRNGFVILTFITCFIAFESIQYGIAGNFEVDQLVGTWFTVGVISPARFDPNQVDCYRIDIGKLGNTNFAKNISLNIDGTRRRYLGFGLISDSGIQVFYPRNNHTAVYNITSYNFGKELILQDQSQTASYALLSQRIYITIGTKKVFERLAVTSGLKAAYFSHDNCSYEEQFGM